MTKKAVNFDLSDPEFDALVIQTFGPVFTRSGLSLRTLRAGIHQVDGKDLKIRIRRGTGHVRDFLITLSPYGSEDNDLRSLPGEIGLGNFEEFRGQRMPNRSLRSFELWRIALEEAAAATDALLIPYVLGQRSDFPDVRRFVDMKMAKRKLDRIDPAHE